MTDPANSPRRIDTLIATYAESHRDPANELIHCICVPAIVLSLLGLLWSLHPLAAVGVALLSLAYYMRLSLPLAFGMAVLSAAMLAAIALLPPAQVLAVSLMIFVVAWIGQFIGHKIEGKKPSFFDDLRFLLIGPLFVLGIVYRRLQVTY